MLPPQFEPAVLPCLVCGRPIERGEFFVVAALANATVRSGTNCEPERPVHLTCLSPVPIRRG